MISSTAVIGAARDAITRARDARTPDYRNPPMTWHRVRARPDISGFQFQDPAGRLHHASPGEVVIVDRVCLQALQRRKAVELL
jgi:hypothetical protein